MEKRTEQYKLIVIGAVIMLVGLFVGYEVGQQFSSEKNIINSQHDIVKDTLSLFSNKPQTKIYDNEDYMALLQCDSKSFVEIAENEHLFTKQSSIDSTLHLIRITLTSDAQLVKALERRNINYRLLKIRYTLSSDFMAKNKNEEIAVRSIILGH